MQHLRRRVAAPAQAALDVEHAAEVAHDDGIGTGGLDVLALVVGETRADLTELEREGPAEAAAGLALGHFGQRQAGDHVEQRSRLRLDAHLAQSRAAVVVGHRAIEAPGHRIDLEHIGEELRELPGLRGEALGTPEPGRIVAEELGVVRAHHAAARAGRRDDGVEALELGDELPRERDRVGPVAGVVGGLATAGLALRDDHLHAGMVEELERGKTDRRTHQVDEAGDEQADAHAARRVRSTTA